MLLVAMTLLGYFSYKQLPVELLPNTELPQLYVSASSRSDLSPAYMEQQVIIPLEGAISAVGGVENMESTVSGRQGSIRVDFKRGTNLKMTTVKLQEKIASIRSDFPSDVSVNVQQANVNGILSIALHRCRAMPLQKLDYLRNLGRLKHEIALVQRYGATELLKPSIHDLVLHTAISSPSEFCLL